jgi:hypothetical protein
MPARTIRFILPAAALTALVAVPLATAQRRPKRLCGEFTEELWFGRFSRQAMK